MSAVTISSPIPAPPQKFTTADGSITGVMDGINNTFTTGVVLKQAFVFRNGVWQTSGVDMWLSGAYIVFLAGAEPVAGDIITAYGYVGP